MKAMIAAVAGADPAMAAVVDRSPACVLRRDTPGRPAGRDHFAALAESILYQQLAGKAAAAIHGRFLALFDGPPTPDRVLGVPYDALRGAGLSGAKARSISDLAAKVADGTVQLDGIEGRDDEDVIARLSQVRGIGRWTAEMFLMFDLGRVDVWPTGDFGVRKGFAIMHDLASMLSPAELNTLGDPYRPYRSVAAWYCWRAAE